MESLLDFVELHGFHADWKGLRLSDDDLIELQWDLMERPDAGSVIPGTGGLRKMRFSPRSTRRGKRGAMRVCYVHFPTLAVILLVAAYGKSAKDDLDETEKRAFRRVIQTIEQELAQRARP